MTEPTEFIDLPAKDFPFTIEFLDPVSERVLWEQRVEGPGCLEIPSARSLGVERVSVRTTYPGNLVVRSK